jgi:predicted AlkP superfamily phosphohydrolase/phosphomutase
VGALAARERLGQKPPVPQDQGRVCLIGLDGATWDLLEPWARAGRLPNLAALMERGAWGTLRSTVPALTLPSWSSLMTGKNPGGHGVFSFWRLDPGRYEMTGLANASDLRSATLWDLAGRAGKRVGVVNVPPSYPLRPVNGFVVGCMLTPPGQPIADPPEVAEALGPDYVIDLKAPRGLRADPSTYRTRSLGFLEALAKLERDRAASTETLVQRWPVDLLAVVFYAPDRVQHNFWDQLDDGPPRDADDAAIREAARAVYAALDDAIGQVVRAAGPDATVILASDHGFVPRPRRSVRINRWLADHGFLAERSLWALRRKLVRKVMPSGWRERYDTLDFIQLNRPRTQAWADTIDYGTAAIWIHATDRYPLGCVTPAQYDDVRERIRTGLAALRDEQGAPVFERVERREDIYRGPWVSQAPDLVAVCTPAFGVVNQSLRRDLRERALFGPFEEAGFTGTHDTAGMYLMAGPPIAARGRQAELPIESIAPTALHLLGLPVPRSLDGPVATALLDPEALRTRPVAYDDEDTTGSGAPAGWGSDEDESQVADHLRALGYLE